VTRALAKRLPATIGQDVFGQFNVVSRLTGNAAAR